MFHWSAANWRNAEGRRNEDSSAAHNGNAAKGNANVHEVAWVRIGHGGSGVPPGMEPEASYDLAVGETSSMRAFYLLWHTRYRRLYQ